MRLKLYQGKWNVVWHDGTRTRRQSLGTEDRQVAERRFRDTKIEAPDDTVADAVALYLKEKQGRARSYEAMWYAWQALKPTFGHLRPDQIDVKLCRQYARARRSAGRSNGTVIKDLSFLRTALKWAKRPGATFELPPTPAPRERHLTRAEFEKLLAACKLLHIRLFAIIAISTAARAGAILELTWDRVDFSGNGRIRLSKGEGRQKGRATVPMTDSVRAALQAAWNARGDGDHVIEWAGKPVRSVKRAFRLAAAKAGIGDVTPHVLRHTAAVWMAEAGRPMEEIAQYLGHTNPSITFRVYARYSPDYLRKAAGALEIGSAHLVGLNHDP